MPRESHGLALLIDRCWSIYLLLNEHVSVPPDFYEEFPVLVERATHSGLFRFTVRLSDQHSLYIREEYEVTGHQLRVGSYSYALTGPAGTPLLRADPLPHHRTDYRKRSLTAFPHHLHEGKERIRSFSGDLSEFMALVKQHVTKSD
jgi:hypothetical protein